MREVVATKDAPQAIGPYSQGVAISGNKKLVFFSGQIALDPATGQLVAGGIFLYRGLTGIAEIYPGERWLYGFLGWSLIYDVVALCWSLTHDPVALAVYFEGKSSCANDFVRLADYFGTSVECISWVNFLFAVAVPLIVGGTFSF